MTQNLKDFAELIKDFISAYLAGGIQHKARADSWRQPLGIFLEANGKTPVNPYADNEKIFNPSVMGYKENGEVYTLDELIKVDEGKREILLKQTEQNDLHFIEKVDLMIFYFDNTAGFGTFSEFRDNYNDYKKPVIIVRTTPRLSLPHWVEWRRYNSLILDKTAVEFKSFTEMRQFFVEYLNFKEPK